MCLRPQVPQPTLLNENVAIGVNNKQLLASNSGLVLDEPFGDLDLEFPSAAAKNGPTLNPETTTNDQEASQRKGTGMFLLPHSTPYYIDKVDISQPSSIYSPKQTTFYFHSINLTISM